MASRKEFERVIEHLRDVDEPRLAESVDEVMRKAFNPRCTIHPNVPTVGVMVFTEQTEPLWMCPRCVAIGACRSM